MSFLGAVTCGLLPVDLYPKMGDNGGLLKQNITMSRHRTFKDPMMQRAYDHFRTAEIKPDRGSSDRAAYWNGREDLGARYSCVMPARSSLTYAIYMAGKDVQTEMDAL